MEYHFLIEVKSFGWLDYFVLNICFLTSPSDDLSYTSDQDIGREGVEKDIVSVYDSRYSSLSAHKSTSIVFRLDSNNYHL